MATLYYCMMWLNHLSKSIILINLPAFSLRYLLMKHLHYKSNTKSCEKNMNSLSEISSYYCILCQNITTKSKCIDSWHISTPTLYWTLALDPINFSCYIFSMNYRKQLNCVIRTRTNLVKKIKKRNKRLKFLQGSAKFDKIAFRGSPNLTKK